MFVILGATGQVGSQVTKLLLDAGKTVRIIGRNPERLATLASKGAIPLTGNIADSVFLVRAFEGSSGVFVMVPPNPIAADIRMYQKTITTSIVNALKEAKVKRAYLLSSVGADLKDGTGPIAGVHELEERMNKIKSLNVVHFRAAYFMENLLWNIDLIRSRGINGSAIKGDLPMHVIATKDIAAAIAGQMLSIPPRGQSVRYLLGERDLTMNEMTAILGKYIRKPDLQYVQFSYDDAYKGMIGTGLSPSTAQSYIEMARAFNDGVINKVIRNAGNTTPTPFEEFAEKFVDIYCADGVSCAAVGM